MMKGPRYSFLAAENFVQKKKKLNVIVVIGRSLMKEMIEVKKNSTD